MNILCFKSCNTDLFDLNLRKLHRKYDEAHFTIVGGETTAKCVPRQERFSIFELSHKRSIFDKASDLIRFAWRSRFDSIYYGYDSLEGYEQIAYDWLALLIPWRTLIISHRLQIREYQSRVLLTVRVLLKSLRLAVLWILNIKLEPKNYKLSFADELLYPDDPIDFKVGCESMPKFHRKTYLDETRNCTAISRNRGFTFKASDGIPEVFSVGFGSDQKSKSVIKLSILTQGKKEEIVRQDNSTLLRGWNDHKLPHSGNSEICVELETEDDRAEVSVSFPVFIQKKKTQNIIVLILDGLNFNHLGIYNPNSKYSPNIDAFFDKQIRYDSAYTQEIWTRPTFASMVTSYYPSHHGIYDKTFFLEVPRALPNLAESLRQNGFYNSAYVSHGWAGQLYGYARGFDRFIWREAFEKPGFNVKDITYFALETLENHKDKNQFIFLHCFDTHLPFFPHSPYRYFENTLQDYRDVKKIYASAKSNRNFSEADRSLIERDAINKVREVDILLEPLFMKLRSKELSENTSVILTADHGFGCLKSNAFLDNGTYRLTPETAQVPLLVSPAQNLGLRFSNVYEELVEASIDLFPSVLDLAGINAPSAPYAASYIPDEDGKVVGKPFVVMESLYFDTYQLVIRQKEQHYYLRCKKEYGGGSVINGTDHEELLFNHVNDPHMKKNLLAEKANLSEPYYQIRKNLGIAEFRRVPSVSVKSKTKQKVF